MKKTFFAFIAITIIASTGCNNQQQTTTPVPAAKQPTKACDCKEEHWVDLGIHYYRNCFEGCASIVTLCQYDTVQLDGITVHLHRKSVQGHEWGRWFIDDVADPYHDDVRISNHSDQDLRDSSTAALFTEGDLVDVLYYRGDSSVLLGFGETAYGGHLKIRLTKTGFEIPRATYETYPELSISDMEKKNVFLDKNRKRFTAMMNLANKNTFTRMGIRSPFRI